MKLENWKIFCEIPMRLHKDFVPIVCSNQTRCSRTSLQESIQLQNCAAQQGHRVFEDALKFLFTVSQDFFKSTQSNEEVGVLTWKIEMRLLKIFTPLCVDSSEFDQTKNGFVITWIKLICELLIPCIDRDKNKIVCAKSQMKTNEPYRIT